MNSLVPGLQRSSLLLRTLMLVVLCLAPWQAAQAMPASQDAPRPLLPVSYTHLTLPTNREV